MSQSLVKIYLHIIFSTKHRQTFLKPQICEELYPYTATVLQNLGCAPIRVGGTDDHIHILCLLSRTISVGKLLEKIKTPTSKWVKTKSGQLTGFYWQGGFAAFSVSQSKVDQVDKYIQNQKTKHQKMTFKEELRELFRKHNVEFDERYVWN